MTQILKQCRHSQPTESTSLKTAFTGRDLLCEGNRVQSVCKILEGQRHVIPDR